MTRTSLLTVATGLVALVAATLVCFLPVTLHPHELVTGPQRGGVNDVTESILPMRQWMAVSVNEHGTWPMWNPNGLGGAPWLGNPQAAAFYPPNWLFILCDQPWMISWILLLHHLWGGIGTWCLARRYGYSNVAAVLSGIAFLGAPYLIANTGEGHYNPVCLIAWMPWAVLCYEGIRAGRPRAGLALSIVLAMAFFCGHVQELLYVGFILTAFAAVDFAKKFRTDRKASRELAGRYVGAGLLMVGLIAVDFLPIWSYTRHSVRNGGVRSADVGSMIDVTSLYQLLNPLALGGPADYAGPGVCYWETVCSFGVIVALLALCSLVRIRSQYPVLRMALLALVCFVFAFGTNAFLFPLMHKWVPGVGLFRAPSRALFHASFAVALLAGAGLDVILAWCAAAMSVSRGRWLLLAGAVICCVGLGTTIARRQFAPASTTAARPMQYANTYHVGIRGMQAESPLMKTVGHPLLWTWLLCAAAAGTAMASRPKLAPQLAWLLVIATTAELSYSASQVLRTISVNDLRQKSPLVDLVQKQLGGSRLAVRQASLSDREAWSQGIRKIHGYEPVALTRYLVVIDALSKKRDAALEAGGFEEIDLKEYEPRVADLLGIKLAVVETRKPAEKVGDWKLIAKGLIPTSVRLRTSRKTLIPIAIYANPTVMPRAFVIGKTKLVDPRQNPAETIAAANPREEILLEKDLLPDGPRSAYRPAKIDRETPNAITLEAELESPGYLVLADTYYPGWTAQVDGKTAPVVPAYVGLRAVPLPAGKHTVTMQFSPPMLSVGATISICSLAVVLIMGLSGTWELIGQVDTATMEEEVKEPALSHS